MAGTTSTDPGTQPPQTPKKPLGGSGSGGSGNDRSPSPTESDGFQMVDVVPEPGEFASLELLHPIIQCLGHDLGNTKRLTHSSLRVVSHSTKLYKEIHELIKKVDEANSPDWESYDKYSTAIEPLENLLYDFAVNADSETYKLSSKELIEALTASDASGYRVTDCVAVVSVWEADRNLVKSLLDSLKGDATLEKITKLAEAEAKESLKHDDISLLSALVKNIGEQTLVGLVASSSTLIRDIKAKAEEINTAFKENKELKDESSVKCVSSLMIINEAIEAYKATRTAAGKINKEWNAHLKKASVWTAAKTLLENVYDHIKDATKVDFAALKKGYDDFVTALNSGKFELPASLLDLIKKAAKVKRPFYLQTLVLVAICKTIADEFTKDPDRKADKFLPLDETLTAGVSALTQAALDIDNLQTMNASELEKKSEALFDDVNTKLTECLKAYNKEGDGAGYKANLKAALEKDKTALQKIQTRLRGEIPFKTPGGASK